MAGLVPDRPRNYEKLGRVDSSRPRKDSIMSKTGKSRNGALKVLFRDMEVTTSRSKSQTKHNEVWKDVLGFILNSVLLNF